LAADNYQSLWQTQLAEAQAAMMAWASLASGKRVLDIACGTGLVSFAAARAVGPSGQVLGVDLSGRMVSSAQRRARQMNLSNCSFARMDAETLDLPDASFDVVLCALGLMYMPDPEQALREMRRVLRAAGRCFRSLMPKCRATCAHYSSNSDSKTHSCVCALTLSSKRSNTVVFP
jgi:ubiquinone/menaquinone biosynthesis C-methylase UbiE